VEATLPPPVPDKAMFVTIEASQEPSVQLADGHGGTRRLSPTDAAPTWPGRARYFVPAGTRLEQVSISSGCRNGFCSGKCKPPDTAYVKVASVEAVDRWIAEDRSTPVTTVLDAAGPAPSYRVTIEASRLPIALQIDGAPRNLAPEVRSGESGPTSTFYVYWTASNAQAPPETVTWTVRATIQGACAGTAGCAVPAGEAVRVLSVVAKEPDAP